MEIKVEQIQTGEGITLKVTGELNIQTAEEFSAVVEDIITGTDRLVIDCQELYYVSSAGLRVFISAHKQLKARKGSLSLCNLTSDVLEIFQITGLDTILDIQ